MTLQNATYYWVRLVTMYRGNRIKKELEAKILIGYHLLCHVWSIIGSDEHYCTYDSDEKMDHRQTCVIPIEEVKRIL